MQIELKKVKRVNRANFNNLRGANNDQCQG